MPHTLQTERKNWFKKKKSPGSNSVASLTILRERDLSMCKIMFLFRLNTEVLVEFGDGTAIGIRKILHQFAFLQQENAG